MDYASTTPICREVLRRMRAVDAFYVNASSLYRNGVDVKNKIDDARNDVAEILQSRKEEIYFTSGGTESNNLAILGVERCAQNNKEKKIHIITSTIEHSSVLEPIRELEKRGVRVTYVKPEADGVISPKEIGKALSHDTMLVSIMMVNNEIGTIQPIREISKVIRDFKKTRSSRLEALSYPYFHTDACQAPNYLEINVLSLGVDLLTLDGGKIYGPKGVGMLFIKKNTKISPIMHGGGQEFGLRSGTESLSLIAGFSEALRVANTLKEKESKRLIPLRDYFIKKILEKIPRAKLNGSAVNRLPNNINVCLPHINSEFAVFELDREGVMCSGASACQSLSDESTSYVIKELYGGRLCHKSSLRFTLGRNTSKKDIDGCLKAIFMLQSEKMHG